MDVSGKEALFSSDGTTAGSQALSLPEGIIIDPDDLPVIGALPEVAASTPLTGVLPTPLHTGTETVTGTGGIAGLQLERITQGGTDKPGSAGWVKASVASNGNWSVQLAFDKPGMLAHVYAANGCSSTIVDLVNGTPTARLSANASLRSVAAGVPGSAAGDMSAKAVSRKASVAATLPGTTHPAAALSVLNTHAGAFVVPDRPRVLHHAA